MMGDKLKELGALLHPPGQLTDLEFYALLGDDTISIKKGSATIGTWRETGHHLDFETATGVRQTRLQAATAAEAALQTIDFVQSLKL
jgi:hypothetical protein